MSTRDEARHWRQARELFRGALELDTAKRPSFLDRAHGEGRLRRDVDLLLDSLGRAGDFLEEPVAPRSEARTEDPYLGLEVGPYRLGERLGRGGMGVVYLAGRIDRELEQQVAVKLLKPGADSREMVRRFRAERQILATLRHPNIAQLYDGGTTESGLPYLVMEHVEGLPIDTYCKSSRLPIRERLELFLKVCDGVAFTHRNLVVHRDLKPSNILVTLEGQPKLLDFGIAKLLNTAFEPRSAVTHTAERMLTPAYASPEQILGQPVSTASDVYALGVLLFRLLTGGSPYPEGGSSVDFGRAICEIEPPRPNAVLSKRGFCRPPGVGREGIAEDLENIVLMALRKEPRLRYLSVDGFAADLRNYLSSLPVVATGGARTYRMRKFMERHRWGVAASTFFVSLLLAFSAAVTSLLLREARAKEQAETMTERWKVQMKHVDQVWDEANHINQLLEESLSALARQGLEVREILRERAEDLKTRFGDEPLEKADMLEVLGVVHRNLGFFQEAEELLVDSLDIRRRELGPRHVKMADSLTELAVLYLMTSALDEAERNEEQALELRRESLGDLHPDVAASWNNLGYIQADRGDLEGAETAFRTALEIGRNTLGEDHPDHLEVLGNLAGLSYERGAFEEAAELFRELLATARRRLGTDDTGLAPFCHNLATVLVRLGRTDEARELFLEAIELHKRARGALHPLVATTLSGLANLDLTQRKFDAAEAALDEVLAIQSRTLGDKHSELANTLRLRGRLFQLTGRLEEAGQAYDRARHLDVELLGPRHAAVGQDLTGLARVAVFQSESGGCEEPAREAIDIFAALPSDHPYQAVARGVLGGCLVLGGRHDEAEPYLTESFQTAISAPGLREVDGREILEYLRELHSALGRPEQTKAYEQMLARARRSSPAS